jgi:hypothetical protein
VSEFGVCTALDDLKSKMVYGCTLGKGVSTYIAQAEGLIELLEIHDCGSTGDSTLMLAEIPWTGCFISNNALTPSSASTLLSRRR